MRYTYINNINIPELQIYKTLRDNSFDANNSFIADSPKVVNLLLQSDIEVKSILATREYYDEFSEVVRLKNITKLFIASKEEMRKIVGHKVHHNCMMHGVRPKESLLGELGDNIVMLDSITSNENVGSIARSAAALGVDSYLVSKQSPHPYSRRALRVSMGYMSRLKYLVYEDIYSTISLLKADGYKIFAAEITPNATPLAKITAPQKWVILLGHEGKGISKEILDICDEVVTIEMQENIKSFNVGVAASIMIYQFRYNGKN